MPEFEVARTLVKSPPELWSELSDPPLLGRLLEPEFGEITITRATPETRLEWESPTASGGIELSASGWGTRVRLTASTGDSGLPSDGEATLRGVLDEIGVARHRPFSRP